MNRRRPPFDPTDRGPFLTPPDLPPRSWSHLKRTPSAPEAVLTPDPTLRHPDRTRLYRIARPTASNAAHLHNPVRN